MRHKLSFCVFKYHTIETNGRMEGSVLPDVFTSMLYVSGRFTLQPPYCWRKHLWRP